MEGRRASIQRGTRIYGFLGVRSENFLEPADCGLDPRTRNPAAQYSGPRETWTLESQQIYIAKLINGGEIQRTESSASTAGGKTWGTWALRSACGGTSREPPCAFRI